MTLFRKPSNGAGDNTNPNSHEVGNIATAEPLHVEIKQDKKDEQCAAARKESRVTGSEMTRTTDVDLQVDVIIP